MILLAGIAAIALGTWLGAPTLTPIVVGAVMGLLLPLGAARRAALAGMLAWAGLLVTAAVRGDALGALSKSLGGAMGIPSVAVVLVTLLYPAILAASAAWLVHLVLGGRSPSMAASGARHETSST